MSAHTCDAQCWAYMIRYGQPDECDPFDARAAADAELEELGMNT